MKGSMSEEILPVEVNSEAEAKAEGAVAVETAVGEEAAEEDEARQLWSEKEDHENQEE